VATFVIPTSSFVVSTAWLRQLSTALSFWARPREKIAVLVGSIATE
jgi:hypothetical protein